MITRGPASMATGCPDRQSLCVTARTAHYAEAVARRMRVLQFAAWIGGVVSASFGILQLFTGQNVWWLGIINVVAAAIFVSTPWLYRFGDLIGPLTFIGVAYASILVICWAVGTDSGLQFYFLGAAPIAVLILGTERIALAATMAALGAGLAIAVEYWVPADTGTQPGWTLRVSFVSVVATVCLMVVATVWYALRETARAEAAMEAEFDRSESLLTNILPASIAARLKDPAHDVVVDKFDDASVLFADIAGFTQNASRTNPADLVRFLDLLYTEFDRLIEEHRLEKIKTSGDSYMVVSGVPTPRSDHLAALARLALDMAASAATMTDPRGDPLRIRIGLAAGPVVAGVVGARRFFYDVWGDAVNVASRMESTDTEGRIQVPQDVYERLRNDFVFEERGDIDVKGKGVMRTWYLVGRTSAVGPDSRATVDVLSS